MSKPMQAAVIGLFALVIISAGIAAYFWMQNNRLTQDNQSLETQISDFQKKEADLLTKAKKLEKDQQDLNDKIRQKEKERDQAQQAYDGLKSKVDDINNQLSQSKQDADDYKGRVETVRKERDTLMEKIRGQEDLKSKVESLTKERDDLQEKLKNQKEKVVYSDNPSAASSEGPMKVEENASSTGADNLSLLDMGEGKGDQYWADVLKEKEKLKLDLQKAQSELDQSALQVSDLKKQNNDIQMQLKNLTDLKADLEKKLAHDRGELEAQLASAKKDYERRVKYSEDLANSLSMEVARVRTDQKDADSHAEKYKNDMLGLQDQIRQLTSTKLALERTIARINEDKVSMQKRLAQTEGVIQGRIDEIWKIKQSLDQKISQLPSTQAPSANTLASTPEVELPPIVVHPADAVEMENAPPPAKVEKKMERPRAMPSANTGKIQGTIISINEPNNFVIVDMGESDGSQVGRKLAVTRGEDKVGALEVIQVRKDISAADIKNSNGALRVGDTVRFN